MPEPMSDERLAEIEAQHERHCSYACCGEFIEYGQHDEQCPVLDLIAEVRRLREVLKPFAHHAMAGMDARSDRERQIRVTEGQLVRADFALMGREFPE
jgi:hypothetical protein